MEVRPRRGMACTVVSLRRAEVVAGYQERVEVEAEGEAVFDGSRAGAGVEESSNRDAGDERFEAVDGGIVESSGAGEAVAAGTLQEDERGLFESAIGDDGLADGGSLAVEVIDTAAGQIEPGVGFQFFAGVAFADLAGLVGGKLVFEGQKDHADGGDDLGHGNGANSPEVGLAMMEEREESRQYLATRPGSRGWQGRFRRDAAKHIEDEKGGDAMDGALDEKRGQSPPTRTQIQRPAAPR